MREQKKRLGERLNTLIQKIALGKNFTTFVSDKCPLEVKKNQAKKKTPSEK